jgi:hypothetical protein
MINQMFDHFDQTLCRVKFDRSFDNIILNQSNTLGSIGSSIDPIILS